MPFLLDPVSPRSPWHPAAGRLAPASGQPRTGGGAASGALGGAAARALHALVPRPPLREAPGRRPGVGFWRGASVHPGLHSRCAWEARSRGTRPAGSRLCVWWSRVVGSGSSMWAVHSGRAGTFVPGPSPGRAIGAIGGPCRASGQVGTEASPPGLTLRSLRAPQAPHPRPPETPSSSSLAVSGSGRRSRGAGPSAGWTSDWTSRPWRVVCLRWPWTAQDSVRTPSLWPFPLTPPVLVPGQGHGGAGLGPDGGRVAQVGPRGLIARLAMTSVQVRPGESLRRPVAPHPAWRRASHSDPPPPTRRGAAE